MKLQSVWALAKKKNPIANKTECEHMALNDPDGLIIAEDLQRISSIRKFQRCSTIKQVVIRCNEKIHLQPLVHNLLVIGYYRHYAACVMSLYRS